MTTERKNQALAAFPLLLSARLSCLLLAAALALPASAQKTIPLAAQRKISFNNGWKFNLADTPAAIALDFDDSNWQSVKIPHDWSIEGPISKNNPSGRQGGFYPGGIGFYRKSFPWQNSWKNQRVLITFDGVMSNSEVWINGHSLGIHPNGYIGFTCDLTPFLLPRTNVITVRADNSRQPASRWYTGCGIYRNVWLTVTHPIAVATHGTWVTAADITPQSAQLQIQTTITNTTAATAPIQIVSLIIHPDDHQVAQSSLTRQIPPGPPTTVNQHITLKDPTLWSLQSPRRYRLLTRLIADSRIIDQYETPFGIRDIRFDADTGFWLNNQNIKIKGVNNHHDAGPVGAAVPLDVLYRRLRILKDMGCNAIRTAHNPAAPEFYDLCDRMGLLVMDEIFDEWIASWPWTKLKDQGKVKYGYHHYFDQWSQHDLKSVLLRDRNHPSVILWSVGNEIPDQCYPQGPLRLQPLMNTVHRLDPTRPVTCGCCFIHLANQTGFASSLDVTGYNGGGGSIFFEKDRKTYPHRKFIATEIPHTFQTRGVYKTKSYMRTPKEGIPVPDLTPTERFPEFSKFYSSSYDNASVRISARDSWRRTSSLPYLAGEFRWTGFDYLGEAIMGWPSRFWNFGIIDLCGFPKDHYFFYQSQWTSKPMVHLLPHWTWPGKEGRIIPVWTYSNADQVELFLNGKSLGARSNRNQMNLSWNVPYTPGTLKAVARTNGRIVAENRVQTAAAPACIQILPDKTSIPADGRSCIHLEVNILDDRHIFVPTADNLITFTISGPAANIGVDNGDPLDLASTKINQRKAFNGKCLLILQSLSTPGPVTVRAASPGLTPQSVQLTIASP